MKNASIGLASCAMLFAAVGALLSSSASAAAATYCADASCWPSASEWTAFNESLYGMLIAIDPPLKPCASSKSDDICIDRLAMSADAALISTLPGGYAYPFFTQDTNDKMCFPRAIDQFDSFRDTDVCEQGSISSFGVAVTREADITATLKFAAQKNLEVVIKNTGLDRQGRSIANKYALMIWLNNYSGITTAGAFKACPSDTETPAAFVRAGTRWGDVYTEVKAANYHVVGSSSRSVGASGGWLQSGGHSFSSPAFGLGVDNVLKFKVTLVNGTTAEASPCSNPDLFWALRGGGGGTYGIVTAVTYKLHEKQVVTGYTFDLTPKTPEAKAELLTTLFTWLVDVSLKANDVVVGGYPTYYGSDFGDQLAGRLVINGTKAQATALLAPLQTKIAALVAAKTLVENAATVLTEKSSFLDWHAEAYPADEPESVGTYGNVVSRLIPMSLCAAPAKLVKVLLDYTAAYPSFMAQLNVVTGGAVSTADSNSKITSVAPSWRDSCLHLVVTDLKQSISSIQSPNLFVATQAEAATKMKAVSDMGKPLRDVAGADRGADFAESDYIEANWADVFWGADNYVKLVAAKIAYDPTNVLRCHHCVASPDKTEAPTPVPTTAAPTSKPTTVAPTPKPTTVAPTPKPTTVAPTPKPTTVAPTPKPTTVAPIPEPTTEESTPDPTTEALTTEAPTPEPTTEEPMPEPTTEALTPESTTATPPTETPPTEAPTAEPTDPPTGPTPTTTNPDAPTPTGSDGPIGGVLSATVAPTTDAPATTPIATTAPPASSSSSSMFTGLFTLTMFVAAQALLFGA